MSQILANHFKRNDQNMELLVGDKNRKSTKLEGSAEVRWEGGNGVTLTDWYLPKEVTDDTETMTIRQLVGRKKIKKKKGKILKIDNLELY